MKYPLVIDLAAEGVPVSISCRVLKFSKQAFYKWLKNPITDRDWDEAHLTNAAIDVHKDDPEFGYRFIHDELVSLGNVTSPNRTARICSQNRLWSVHSKKRGLNRKSGPPVHDDHVLRDFKSQWLDGLWLTDITEHMTAEGKLYLCAVKDAYSNRIVGYSFGDRMKAELAVRALNSAIMWRRPLQTIVHSDRGSQFRSKKYVRVLKNNQLTGSMGRVGHCADNAAMESFFSLLQKNVLNRKRWSTRAELQSAIVSWIEVKYHRRRRQTALGRLTPVEFETIKATLRAA